MDATIYIKNFKLFLLLLILGSLIPVNLAGKNHGGGNRLMELLTAGIVAKVLQKDDGHGGGGDHGGGYYTVPVPLPMGSKKIHHHVTEKIIPIPIPHHTTRIIHINAGHGHGGGGSYGGGGGGSYGGGGGGSYGGEGGYDHEGGGGGYSDHDHDSGHGSDVGGGDYHPDDSRSQNHHSPTIQQLFFHDGGVYGAPQAARPPVLHPPGLAMRRPAVMGMAHYPGPALGMVGHPHPAVSAAHPYPSISSPYLQPSLSSPYRYPTVSGSHPQMVRVRHYFPLASNKNKILAYPSMPQLRYQPQMMVQRNRYPRIW